MRFVMRLIKSKWFWAGFIMFFFGAMIANAQTVSPFMGVGNVQEFDNNGEALLTGVLYTYQAGTTTQQATYTDSTGTIQNPDPIPFGSGGRAAIWLTSGATYKFVLCTQNDGPTCAAGDILFSVDQVPGSSSSGSSSGSPFTGTFISGSANPATTGILRLASGDSACWRNTAGSANLCWSKDGNDVLSWSGGSVKFPLSGVPGTLLGFDILWADSTSNRWMMENNGGVAAQIVGSGVDINTSDQVTQLHFGLTGLPLSTTAPLTNQYLQWNGTNVIGTNGPVDVDLTAQNSSCATQTFITPAANGFYRFEAILEITQAATTSSQTPALSLNYTTADSSTARSNVLTGQTTGNAVGTTLGVIVNTITPSSIYAKSGVPITMSCSGYTSSGATQMQYSVHARLTGPF